jgi:hypothetical protein
MSGPIVRRYGFPNFEQIFGKRELQHGVEEGEAAEKADQSATPSAPKETAKPAAQKPADAK